MARHFPALTEDHIAFIARQHIFFTGSAAATGRVNISPREAAALRVLGPNRVAYLDQTGSGAETAAHIHAGGRLTVMLCAFQGPPLILRLYGTGESHPKNTSTYAEILASHFSNEEPEGARQIIALDIDLVQTSCGYGVPMFDFKQDRPTLRRWAEAKGPEGLATYRAKKNAKSLDGFPTGLS